MGTFRYGASQTALSIDDRTLAHLQTVVTTKLRRSEGMLLHWDAPVRGAAWIHPHCDISYEYDETGEIQLASEVLDRMMSEASGTRGLKIELQAAPSEPGRA